MRVLAWPGTAHRQQPYITQLYTHLQRLGVELTEFSAYKTFGRGYDVWHMHWPENRLLDPNPVWAGLQATRLLAEMQAARARGTKILWTAHNLGQHEKRHPHMEPLFWQRFTRLLDGWIALSPDGRRLAEAKFPALRSRPSFIVPLGHYRGCYRDDVSRSEARRVLGISPSARVVGFVGQIRAYKNVPHLVRTFKALPEPDSALLIVGRTKDAWLQKEIRAAAGDDPRVRLFLEFAPDDDVQLYLRAADLLALPYQDILNSSSAVLALSFDVPVLVPARGAMDDLQRYTGRRWVRTFAGELTARALAEALTWAEEPRPALALSELSWDKLAGQTLNAYKAVCTGKAVGTGVPAAAGTLRTLRTPSIVTERTFQRVLLLRRQRQQNAVRDR